MSKPRFSICTTNYNCAHALSQHLDSVYSQLDEDEFEYIIVDNKSKDDSLSILKNFEKGHGNMRVLSQKCSMGRGRQIAFKHSIGDVIMVIDTDTVYFPVFKSFVDIYLEQYTDVAVQAILCGMFPRKIWEEIGGRRDLNIYEDLDMWIRIWKLGKMRWYPVYMGDNIKEQDAQAGGDYMSDRYKKLEKIRRFIRREYDLLRLREIYKIDIKKMYNENVIDLGLGETQSEWLGKVQKLGFFTWFTVRRRELRKILKS